MACQPARDVLQASGYPALAAGECSVEAGIVELRGTVGSYYLKQVAQELVQRVKAVRQVRNSIEVFDGCWRLADANG